MKINYLVYAEKISRGPQSQCSEKTNGTYRSRFNSVWPCDAIWRHRTWSPLAEVTDYSRMAPRHYYSQCWLTTNWTLRNICQWNLNSLCATVLSRNIDMYLQFILFLHTDMAQVVGILPRVRQGLAYFSRPISLLLMTWRRKESGHQQQWYWPN